MGPGQATGGCGVIYTDGARRNSMQGSKQVGRGRWTLTGHGGGVSKGKLQSHKAGSPKQERNRSAPRGVRSGKQSAISTRSE